MMRQIEWSKRTEAFVIQAAIRKPPSFFEREQGIAFTETEDGLDLYRAALFLKDETIPVMLKQYRGNNRNETGLYLAPDCEDLDEITRLITNVITDLGLTSADVVWQRKDSWQG